MKFNPTKIETEMLDYWKENQIYAYAKQKNKGKQKFYFLDGPPYTTGSVHVGTAWNKTMKDVVLRYKRMKGYDVWDRAGYDMHGLPIENAVAKDLNLHTKNDIKKYGVDKFVKKCKEYAVSKMDAMNKTFKRMAIWMDFDHAYQPISHDYINGVWWLIKKADENNRLYKGKRTMAWCPHCATALAKHELVYKTLKENSIFVKFKVNGTDDTYLIIWTTTPWTIAFNMGIMVNPNIDYVKAKVGNEIWYVAKDRVTYLVRDILKQNYEILEQFKGKELEGISYTHPFEKEIPYFKTAKEKSEKVHTVVLSEEYVNTSDGTGLVHMAPGCGPEDYEVGYKNKIPPFNEIDETGTFKDSMGVFSGWKAKKDDSKFIEYLKAKNAIVAVVPIEHDYAHCWRCKSPIVYKTTEQWFFKVEDLVEKMRIENKDISWNPKWAGSNWFDSWLENLRDNSITRQRFWGTPIPIWECKKCKTYEIFGSVEDLKKRATNKVPEDLHRPLIDTVTVKCPKCGGEMHRIPDILDVWVDSGTSSWNSLYYPKKKEFFQKYFPADFIIEGKDQIRGWFNLLLVTSMVSMGKVPFKSVYMHGFINDSLGRKMSKSLKNYITPEEIIDKYGSDLMRYYFVSNSEPGLDLNYNPEDVSVKFRNLNVLWNLSNYLIDLVKNSNLDAKEISESLNILDVDLGAEEKYIVSRLNSTIKNTTDALETYDFKIAIDAVESFYLELSRVYVKMIRDKISDNPKPVISVLYNSIISILKLLAPFIPLLSDRMYLNLCSALGVEKAEKSLHLNVWPKYDLNLINPHLESHFETVKQIIQTGLKIRDKIGLGVRWPLSEMIIETSDKKIKDAVFDLEPIILKQLNIKSLYVKDDSGLVTTKVDYIYGSIAKRFGKDSARIMAVLTTMSKESILSHIKENKSFSVNVDLKDYELTPSDFSVKYSVDEQYVLEKYESALIIINRKTTKTLFAEGLSRELIRRVQQMRKKAGLDKTDKISLKIFLEDIEDAERLLEFRDQIKSKTGSDEIKISSGENNKDCRESEIFEIKKHKGALCISF